MLTVANDHIQNTSTSNKSWCYNKASLTQKKHMSRYMNFGYDICMAMYSTNNFKIKVVYIPISYKYII